MEGAKITWSFCHPFIKKPSLPCNQPLPEILNLVNRGRAFRTNKYHSGEFQCQSDLAAMMEIIHHFR